jgi:hypothetical protein
VVRQRPKEQQFVVKSPLQSGHGRILTHQNKYGLTNMFGARIVQLIFAQTNMNLLV